MVPAHALRSGALAGAALLALLQTGCPPPARSDGGADAPRPTPDPTLEVVGRPIVDCTELRFVVAVRANGQLVPLTADQLAIGVAPVVDAGAPDAAAPPLMEQPASNSCFGLVDAGAGGYAVCLRGLTTGQPHFVHVRAPFDGGTLQLTTLLTPACPPNDAGDAAADATDATARPDAPGDTGAPDASDAGLDAALPDATLPDGRGRD